MEEEFSFLCSAHIRITAAAHNEPSKGNSKKLTNVNNHNKSAQGKESRRYFDYTRLKYST